MGDLREAETETERDDRPLQHLLRGEADTRLEAFFRRREVADEDAKDDTADGAADQGHQSTQAERDGSDGQGQEDAGKAGCGGGRDGDGGHGGVSFRR
jgi:hypothetical protein